MATALGLDIDQTGKGTTAQDLRRIIGSVYRTPGIISGAAVARSSTAMSYQVFDGSVVMDWGGDEKVIVPVPRTTLPTEQNPGVTARRDKVFVKQQTVEADGSNDAYVGITTGSLPPRSFLLADYEVPANTTKNTSEAIDRANRIYTRQAGAQYGQVAKITDNDSTPHTGKKLVSRGPERLFFGAMTDGVAPTDRDMMVHLTSCISAADRSPFEATGSVIYKIYINDKVVATFERVFNRFWEAKTFSVPVLIQQPVNTIRYTVQWKSGYEDWQVRAGGPDQYPGDTLVVMDHGAANL